VNLKLLSVKEAQNRLLSQFTPMEAEIVSLTQLGGRVLSNDIVSEFDLPRFSNSAMDGFAVLAADLEGASKNKPISLKVVADIPAGILSEKVLITGQAARIMTGAPMLGGADAVAPVEYTDFNHRLVGVPAPDFVTIFTPVKSGAHIRIAGEDVSRGDIVLRKGIRVRPQDIGFLSMLGISSVCVHRKPRVAVFSSGDELLPVEAPLSPGKIYDSNTYMLIALFESYGCETLNLGIAKDRVENVKSVLDDAVKNEVDLIVSSAGVSVGAFDFVRSVVEETGELDFWRVNMRPGKPVAFGRYRGISFFGLPGNPVSAFVGFEVFVRPALQKMSGLNHTGKTLQRVKLSEPIESDGRESYLRANIANQDGEIAARLTGHQGSGNLHSLVRANALLIVPSGVKSLEAGDYVDVWFIGD